MVDRSRLVQEGNGSRKCGKDKTPLIYEDGVLFCPKCLTVVMRLEKWAGGDDELTTEAVDWMIGRGWEVAEIAKVIGLTEARVLAVARELGWEAARFFSQQEKREIVEMALEVGTTAAGSKYGVSAATVAGYLREMGLGKQQRFEKLKVMALQLIAEGVAIAETARRLGVDRKTVKKWRKMGKR